uniref:Uncharacterized protein n=1 Tax=viral metagenome TaxID=1070528 RepID=A0A6C0DHQ8_9ZZZZ
MSTVATVASGSIPTTVGTAGPKIIRDADDTVENYTLYIGGERFQVNDGELVNPSRFEAAYPGVNKEIFKRCNFLVFKKVSDLCYDRQSDKDLIKKAIQNRIDTLRNQSRQIVIRRLKDKAKIRLVEKLEEILIAMNNATGCAPANPFESPCEKTERKYDALKLAIEEDPNVPQSVRDLALKQGGGDPVSDMADPDNYLQTAFKLLYVLAHPERMDIAKKEWTKVLDSIQTVSLEDIVSSFQDHVKEENGEEENKDNEEKDKDKDSNEEKEKEENNNSNNNNTNNNNSNNGQLTENQIQKRLRTILQLLQTHHYLEDNLDLNAFSKENSSKDTFTYALDTTFRHRIAKALDPIYEHYKHTYPSLYEFIEQQENVPLASILSVQVLAEEQKQAHVKDHILRVDNLNTKPYKKFMKEFNMAYKGEKPEIPFTYDGCLILEGRNFRVPDNLTEAVEREIIEPLGVLGGKRSHMIRSVEKALRSFFSKKGLFLVVTNKTEEELNTLSVNLEEEEDEEGLLEQIRADLPGLTLDKLGITIHQNPSEPIWTDTLNGLCAVIAFKKELTDTLEDGGEEDDKDNNTIREIGTETK